MAHVCRWKVTVVTSNTIVNHQQHKKKTVIWRTTENTNNNNKCNKEEQYKTNTQAMITTRKNKNNNRSKNPGKHRHHHRSKIISLGLKFGWHWPCKTVRICLDIPNVLKKIKQSKFSNFPPQVPKIFLFHVFLHFTFQKDPLAIQIYTSDFVVWWLENPHQKIIPARDPKQCLKDCSWNSWKSVIT